MRIVSASAVALLLAGAGMSTASAQNYAAPAAGYPTSQYPQAQYPQAQVAVPQRAAPLQPERRVPDLRYWACDGMNFLPRYTANWTENEFTMKRIDGLDTRHDGQLNFVDWDMTCWGARWDPERNTFIIKHLPHEENEQAVNEIKFIAHDLTPWSARRDGNGWMVRPGVWPPPKPEPQPFVFNPYGGGPNDSIPGSSTISGGQNNYTGPTSYIPQPLPGQGGVAQNAPAPYGSY